MCEVFIEVVDVFECCVLYEVVGGCEFCVCEFCCVVFVVGWVWL